MVVQVKMKMFYSASHIASPNTQEEEPLIVSSAEAASGPVVASDVQMDQSTETEEVEEDQNDALNEQLDLEEKIARIRVLDFQKDVRDLFLSEWMTQEGDWLSKLTAPQVEFLKDCMGLKSHSSTSMFGCFK